MQRVKQIINYFDEPIDYVGQKTADNLLFWIFVIGYSLSLLIGFIMQNLKYTLIFGIITVILAFIVVIPSWSFYKRNPVEFKKEKDE
ncbi:hypothetical protein H311_02463 [Anncaliia algerae PRA109]|nr:hypothetical protein H311_02463 [Anncaliia algerae PRA109]